jgi:hypothetical protein
VLNGRANPKAKLKNRFRYFPDSSVAFLINAENKSIGIGKNVVVLCSLEISLIVCRKRNCSAMGWALIIAAASTSFVAA